MILKELQIVNPAAWKNHLPFRRELHKKDGAELSDEDIEICIEDRRDGLFSRACIGLHHGCRESIWRQL